MLLIYTIVYLLASPKRQESVAGPRKNRRWWIGAAAGALVLVLALLEGSGLTHLTEPFRQMFPPAGTLILELEDRELIVRINDTIVDPLSPQHLRPGTYRLQVYRRGELIHSESVDIPIGPCTVTRTFPSPDERAAAQADFDRLQGDWESILVMYIGGREPGAEALPLSWLRVDGNRLHLRLPGFDMTWDGFKVAVIGSSRKLLLNATYSTSTFSITRPAIAYEFLDQALHLRIDEPQPSVLQDVYREQGLPLPTPRNHGLEIVLRPKGGENRQRPGSGS
jgi:hypothetical protein